MVAARPGISPSCESHSEGIMALRVCICLSHTRNRTKKFRCADCVFKGQCADVMKMFLVINYLRQGVYLFVSLLVC